MKSPSASCASEIAPVYLASIGFLVIVWEWLYRGSLPVRLRKHYLLVATTVSLASWAWC